MKLAICSIFRDEARYLREFIEFHLLQGVKRFYLFNNRSSDDYMSVLWPYMKDDGPVKLRQWPHDPPCQLPAYQNCIVEHQGEKRWIAFLDIDEFLFSPRYAKVTDALETLPYRWGAVGVNWVCFGNSGKEKYEAAPVIERFTWRVRDDATPNLHIKSIIRMDQQVQVGGDAHFFHCDYGTFTENGKQLYGPFTEKHSSWLLRVNHYVTKSDEELRQKIAKGRVDMPQQHALSDFDCCQARDVDDRDIQRFLPQLKERLCQNSHS